MKRWEKNETSGGEMLMKSQSQSVKDSESVGNRHNTQRQLGVLLHG